MRFHRLDLNLLVVFDHLLQGRSVSETGRRLNLSQPAISNALARLRAHFKDELFISVGRKLEPTPFAKSLTNSVKIALTEIERVIIARAEFTPETAQRNFTIVCSDYVYSTFLVRAIRKLAIVAPDISLLILPNTLINAPLITEGSVDFLITPPNLHYPLHPHVPLFSDEFTCIAWVGNEAIGDHLSAEQYLTMRHVSVSFGPKSAHLGEFEPHDMFGLGRRIAVFAPTFSAVAEAVVGTPYLATLHTRAARLYAERLPIKLLDLPLKIDGFGECLQWHRTMDNDAGTVWMKEFLIECARNF